MHILSFIGWPLEFRHSFLYFAATLVEALAFTQVTQVAHWFLLSAAFGVMIWVVYWYDLRLLARQVWEPEGPAAQRLLEAARRDQLQNLRLILPFFIGFDLIAALLVLRWHAVFLGARWHLLLVLVQAGVGIWYLLAGLPSLAGMDSLIYQRFLERQAGLARSG